VFISASFLVRCWKKVPPNRLEDSILFFGSKRSWVFPANAEETAESKQQPTDYLGFEAGFKQLILEKEKQGLVYWL
jgi:hypothetical protein